MLFDKRHEKFVSKWTRLSEARIGPNDDVLFFRSPVEVDFVGSSAGTFCIMTKKCAGDPKKCVLHEKLVGRWRRALYTRWIRDLSRLVATSRDRSRQVRACRDRSHLLDVCNVLVHGCRRDQIFFSISCFDLTTIKVTFCAVALNSTRRAGKSRTCVTLQRLVNGENEIAVGSCRDRSRQVATGRRSCLYNNCPAPQPH